MHSVKCVSGRRETPSLVVPFCFTCKCLYPAKIPFLEKQQQPNERKPQTQPKKPFDRPDADVLCLICKELTLVGFGGEQRTRGKSKNQISPVELLSGLTSWKSAADQQGSALSWATRCMSRACVSYVGSGVINKENKRL